MESTRWLCLQHRLLKAETGLPLDTSSKRRRPKVGGGLLRPKKSTNRPQMCNHFQWFFGEVIFDTYGLFFTLGLFYFYH